MRPTAILWTWRDGVRVEGHVSGVCGPTMPQDAARVHSSSGPGTLLAPSRRVTWVQNSE